MRIKNINRINIFFIAVLAIFLFLSFETIVAEESPKDENSSIFISFLDKDSPIQDMEVKFYYVASFNAEKKPVVIKELKKYPIAWNEKTTSAKQTLAETLAAYVIYDGIAYVDKKKTNSIGEISFLNKKEGIYLIVPQKMEKDGKFYQSEPILIGLPLNKNQDSLSYNAKISPKIRITLKQTVSKKLSVTKKWKDEGYEHLRPKSITVHILKNEMLEKTVSLNDKNHWTYEWISQQKSDDYRVVEEVTDKYYEISVQEQDGTFLIINKYVPDDFILKRPLPQTGFLWWKVQFLALSGLILFGIGYVKYRK